MNERQELIAALREVADFLEANPEFPTPRTERLDVFVGTKEEYAACVRMLGGGKKDKQATESFQWVRREFVAWNR